MVACLHPKIAATGQWLTTPSACSLLTWAAFEIEVESVGEPCPGVTITIWQIATLMCNGFSTPICSEQNIILEALSDGGA